MCYALPLDYKNAALNLGFSGGLMLPWSKSCVNRPLFPPRANKIFLSENSSVFGFMGGLDSLWSLRYRGVHGPNIGMQTRDDSSSSLMNIALDGDLAFSAFADLSFDLPVKVLRDKGIYGHVFASAGSVLKLKEIKPNNFSLRNLMESFRTSVKCGIVLPIKNRYNMEVNICHIMERSFNQIESKFGLQLCFSILRPQMVTLTAKKK
ncbi:uncharacterized protein LOC110700770 [Chenopodium quinoa]|uniref:uncharacterized protein LOC110700770 n=1 Tax=Chenopodium quinoa TaxID=63459 RepID=UPI000B777492|nr:uncharacterized protein LOC110700770 [Chenopodium quinoa]